MIRPAPSGAGFFVFGRSQFSATQPQGGAASVLRNRVRANLRYLEKGGWLLKE